MTQQERGRRSSIGLIECLDRAHTPSLSQPYSSLLVSTNGAKETGISAPGNQNSSAVSIPSELHAAEEN